MLLAASVNRNAWGLCLLARTLAPWNLAAFSSLRQTWLVLFLFVLFDHVEVSFNGGTPKSSKSLDNFSIF